MKPSFELSQAGQYLAEGSGIFDLMEDLGRAARGPGKTLLLGGASPGRIPEVEKVWQRRLEELLREPDALYRCLGLYDPPGGNPAFTGALAKALRESLGWPVEPDHVVVTLGSQWGVFLLFLLFAGRFRKGSFRQVLLPRLPEYLGFAQQGLGESLFRAALPAIELLTPPFFRYRMDRTGLISLVKEAGAICLSCPCNPTGQTFRQEEWQFLKELSCGSQIPLIVDGAYGAPFPSVTLDFQWWSWDPSFIYCFTLSKLGLPGVRTGIVLAPAEVAAVLRRAQSVLALAPPGLGQELLRPLLDSGELFQLVEKQVRPFYLAQYEAALSFVRQFFEGRFPYRVHIYEGGFFLWIWFPELPISSAELYERLKTHGVYIVPGRHFAYGLSEEWAHVDQCIRISFTQPLEILRAGIEEIAIEVERLHGKRGG
ncbi:aminotransferase class I/II-fold pyridoxal phosphate-dependent enzyme [Candidatus Methylacidithermus pantelleriae]|uniref:Valine--pyruvate aminotransferase n=1 Tax=Candidatus Methylacidithermus pantelleriae TaxID=2744239 RepID=A0A8J2BNN2_9BACT|nr:aminotransferase class I/II-fold pyridoxal phosphate-dependent enzyme [Candidatus Methylacidithermus pantelleriae]CAF0696941.1 Valine--pyruvate aminotransferase [Candidatus Methylacidithermus pantelleriae]